MNDPEGPGGDAQPAGEPEHRPDLDIDSAFAAIIADFSVSVPRGTGPWPASEDLDDPDDDRSDGGDGGTDRTGGTDGRDRGDRGDRSGREGDPAAEHREPPRRRIVLPDEELTVSERPSAGSGRDAQAAEPVTGSRGDADDEDDEGYVPPIPPPLPRGDLVSRLAWGGVIGGPLFLLIAALTWRRTLPSVLLFLALVAFVSGFVTLVARMPSERPDDPDDGAVV